MKRYKKIFNVAFATLFLTGSALSAQASTNNDQSKKRKAESPDGTTISVSVKKHKRGPMKNEKHYKTSTHAVKLETSMPHGQMEAKTISRHYKLKYTHIKEDQKVSMKPQNRMSRNYKRPH